MRTTGKYDGNASITRSGPKYRVWIEAPNVTAETYITARRAREIYEALDFIFNPPSAPKPERKDTHG